MPGTARRLTELARSERLRKQQSTPAEAAEPGSEPDGPEEPSAQDPASAAKAEPLDAQDGEAGPEQ